MSELFFKSLFCNFSAERVYEDHEMLVDNLMLWTRESKNKILFAERSDKISLFQTPEKFLLSEDDRGTYLNIIT